MGIVDPPRLHALNHAGLPYAYLCAHCREDFNGRELWKRHRVGRAPNQRCLTTDEMMLVRGWWMDRHGRWRQHKRRSRELEPR